MNSMITAEQQKQIERLAEPFHPDDISWRVTNKSKDGKRGCVIPYGDQRAYTDRLNEIFTPSGWTRSYVVTTLSPITRKKKNETIQTGKVIVTCVVTIHDLGSHSGSGEMWADDENAMTRAEAQAFKRACSCFGLGRYFYDFAEMWVDLDDYGHPKNIPNLPKWALPAGVVPIKEPEQIRKTASGPTAAQSATRTTKPATTMPAPDTTLDDALTTRIEGFRQIIGDALYFEVFRRGGSARNARELPSRQAQENVLQSLETRERGINKLRELAEEVHEDVFFGVLDAHKVQSIDKLPSFEILKAVVTDLQNASQGVAA
jgi:hypothetical protein